MSESLTLKPVLADGIWSSNLRFASSAWLKNLLLIGFGSLVLALSSRFMVDFYPVPLTFQTLVVLGLSMAYGKWRAVATVGLWLAEGAMGLPVFAKGAGIAYMVGPTGGYLAGMLAASWLVGYLAERGLDRKMVTTAMTMVLGNLVIYIGGLAWLGQFLGFGQKLFSLGLFPFLLGDAVKIVMAVIIFPSLWRLVNRSK